MDIVGRTFWVEKINSRGTKTKLNLTWYRKRQNSRSKCAKGTVITSEFKEFFKGHNKDFTSMVGRILLWPPRFPIAGIWYNIFTFCVDRICK